MVGDGRLCKITYSVPSSELAWQLKFPIFSIRRYIFKRCHFLLLVYSTFRYSYLQTHTLEIMMQRCFVPCFGKQCFFVFEEIFVDTMIP